MVVCLFVTFVVLRIFSSCIVKLLDLTLTSFGRGIIEWDSRIRGREFKSRSLEASWRGEVCWRRRRGRLVVVVDGCVVVLEEVVVRIRVLLVVFEVASWVVVVGVGVVDGLGALLFFLPLIDSSLWSLFGFPSLEKFS